MDVRAGDVIVGLMMAVFGLAGLFLAAGAADNEMYVFGMALVMFACLFNFNLVRRYYDEQDAARATARLDAASAPAAAAGGKGETASVAA